MQQPYESLPERSEVRWRQHTELSLQPCQRYRLYLLQVKNTRSQEGQRHGELPSIAADRGRVRHDKE